MQVGLAITTNGYKEFDFLNTTGEAYNVFPDAEGLDSYREEGVYRLPDSLVAVFFPTIASPSRRAYSCPRHPGKEHRLRRGDCRLALTGQSSPRPYW